MRIIVGSTNPVKIACVREGFARVFPDATLTVDGVAVESGVSDQPMNLDETQRGAFNRSDNARWKKKDADYWVGIEGGVEEVDDIFYAFAWIVIRNQERTGQSRTASFMLPEKITRLVRSGTELGDADDEVFGRSNSKQSSGSVGILTHDLIDRTAFYTDAVILALIPFINLNLDFTG